MRGWLDREGWERLCRGDDCPLCVAVARTHDQDEHGVTLVRTASSLIRLARNQRARGYCVVIAARHAVEPFDLPAAEAGSFFADVMATARALQKTCAPIKLNYELLGNGIPHLHCHVLPRYPRRMTTQCRYGLSGWRSTLLRTPSPSRSPLCQLPRCSSHRSSRWVQVG
jgi:diadenosine tetraphosphate (Ap4A) HIT family hydrolase